MYGLTPLNYETKMVIQGDACDICKGVNRSGIRLAVDHDHTTGQVRGLLCSKCNTSLERIETVPLWHEKALQYLKLWK